MPPKSRRTSKAQQASSAPATAAAPAIPPPEPAPEPADAAGHVCFICAEPVKYFAVSTCNHRTCHVCSLRLRALYKKRECTFCKAEQATIIQTTDPDAPFESLGPAPFNDPKLNIAFESQEMMEDTLLLLRFNCPDTDCTFYGTGWSDLKQHVRGVHKKAMCHICIGAKKIFAHEHTLYTNAELAVHVPSVRRREKLPAGTNPSDVEGGVHPLCEFCNECFFSDEELYPHMRDRHEKCFVCERNGNRFVYFRNYEELETHFGDAHFLCTHPTCREQKFVVFSTQLDLKAHTVETHGTDLSAKDKRDARRLVDVTFQAPPSAPAGAASNRRRHFGAGLTVPPGSGQEPPPPVIQVTPRHEEPPEDLDPTLAAAQTAFLARFTPGAALATRAAMRSFRGGESSARDVISTLFSVLERELDATSTHINQLVESFPPDKRTELLSAWRDFQIEQRSAFPDLVPRQAQAGSEYAGAAAGRMLNVKHKTASRSGAQSRRVWDRVAQAAASTPPNAAGSSAGPSSRPATTTPASFPSLDSGAAAGSKAAGGAHTTPWTSSSSSSAQSFRPAAPPAAPARPTPSPTPRKAPAPKLSTAAFPSLPSASGPSVVQNLRQQGFITGNTSARKIAAAQNAASEPVGNAWGGGSAGSSGAATPAAEEEVDGSVGAGGGGKKKKGKQKQTLFTLGAFPTN